MMNILNQQPSKKELKQLTRIIKFENTLRPYWGYWDEWKISKACFLREREITIIEYFDQYESFAQVAGDLNLSVTTIETNFRRACMKLTSYYKHFKEWTADLILEKAGIYVGMTKEERFMSMPIYQIGLPEKLRSHLDIYGKNMRAVLDYITVNEISKHNGIGKKSMLELENVFAENDCLHHFKNSMIEEDKNSWRKSIRA